MTRRREAAMYPRFRRYSPVLVTVAVLAGLCVPLPAVAAPATLPAPRQSAADKPAPGHDLRPAAARPRRDVRNAPARTLPRAASAAVPGGAPTAVGGLPVTVGTKATVTVLDQATAAHAKVPGVLLRLAPAGPGSTRLTVGYGRFREAYGGDWASRLRLWHVPDCGLSTPDSRGCAPTVLPTRNDVRAGTVSTDAARPGVLALAAGQSGPTGDYTATSLGESGHWQVGESAGSFNWSYPLRLPPVPGGAVPSLALSYSSGAVDGRTSAQNAQPSAVGEGWDLWPGYVERRYRTCSEDGTSRNTADLCWGPDNLTLSLNGRTTVLVKDDTSHAWHPRNDDGSTVEQVSNTVNHTGQHEAFKVTTQDGTQYFFGSEQLPGFGTATSPSPTNATWTVPVFGNDSGEPCPTGCTQGYRWNLDYVLDLHGNAIAYYYKPELNNYGPSGRSYVRGGTLDHVDYGFQNGHAYDTTGTARPAARVVFAPASRCDPDVAGCTSFPDTPRDQACTAASCTAAQAGPTFWSAQMLATITTRVLRNGAYTDVDKWTLAHKFPAPGDGQAPALWLNSIVHTGLVGGTIDLPAVTFDHIPLQNRVDAANFPAQNKMRISEIHTELGGTIGVNYAPQECSPTHLPAAPESDTMRCFAQWWSPPGQQPQRDWFHKYVVASVTESDGLQATDKAGGSPPKETHYAYGGGAAWHFNDADETTAEGKRTWSDWRGYGQVTVTTGAATEQRSEIVDTFYRGMDGDHLPSGPPRQITVTDSTHTSVEDSDGLAGQVREHIVHNGPAGTEVAGSIGTPFRSAPTARHAHPGSDGITVAAYLVRPGSDAGRTRLDDGTFSRTLTDRSYDGAGRLTQVDNQGDKNTTADDLCTTTDYITDDTRHILALPYRTTVIGKSCTAGAPVYPGDGVSQTLTFYDNSTTLNQLPNTGKGDPTMVQTAKAFGANGASAFVTTRASFDGYGRTLTATDPMSRTTTYTYTGQPVTQSTVTTPPAAAGGHGFTTTTVVDPAWGVPLSTTDVNGHVTEKTYDALGRLTGVWLPDRPRDTQHASPSTGFAYQVSNATASWQRTDHLTPSNSVLSSYSLYDGLARERQTQTPTEDGRLVTDTYYDTRGHPVRVYNPNLTSGAPSGTVFVSAAKDVLSETDSVFDGADRVTAVITKSDDREQWRSTNGYHGDHVDVTPPAGATATTSFVDAAGRTTELRQHHGGQDDTTTYAYTRTGQLSKVTTKGGAHWDYGYDVLGRMTSSSGPDTGSSTVDYDDSGAVTRTTDGRGRAVAYAYDGMGRRTGAFDGSLTGPQLSKWSYDTVPGPDPDNAPQLGLPASSTQYVGGAAGDAYTETITGYDANGHVTGDSVSVPASEQGLAGTYDTFYSYAPDGSPNTITYPAAGGLPRETVTTMYDAAGLPKTLGGASSYVTDSVYDSSGNPKRFDLSVGGSTPGPPVQLFYTFDRGTGRLMNQTVSRQGSADPVDIDYTYDDAGDLTSATDSGSDHPVDRQCFRYDGLQRLTEAWTPTGDCATAPAVSGLGGPAPYWQSYSYDDTGNRTGLVAHAAAGDTTSAYTYPAPNAARPHTLQSVTTTGPAGSQTSTFDYDLSGNTTTRAGQTLTWDSQDHLVTAGGATYRYDASGARLTERDSTGATLYLPNGMELHWDKTTTTATRYYSHDGHVVAMRKGAKVTWLAADPHGTVQSTLSSTNAATTTRRMDPFGNTRGTAPTPWDSHGFLNAPIDPGTGLTHLGARDYDPTLGRFISADPVANTKDPQQLNGYAYADNNPTTGSDATGLLPKGCLDTCSPDEPTFIDTSGAVRHQKPRGGPRDGSGTKYIDGDGCAPGVPLCVKHTTFIGPTQNYARITHTHRGYTYVNDLLVVSGNPQLDRLVWEALQLNSWRARSPWSIVSALYKPVPDMSPTELAKLLRDTCDVNHDLCTGAFVAGLDAAIGGDWPPGSNKRPEPAKPAPRGPETESHSLCLFLGLGGCVGVSHDDQGNRTFDLSFGVGTPGVGYSDTHSPGTASGGLTSNSSVSAGFLTAGVNSGKNGTSPSYGLTTDPVPGASQTATWSIPFDALFGPPNLLIPVWPAIQAALAQQNGH
jgi:RHS repeat-associated protein